MIDLERARGLREIAIDVDISVEKAGIARGAAGEESGSAPRVVGVYTPTPAAGLAV